MTLQVRYCPQCGTRRTGYFRFCGRCGLDFDEVALVKPEDAGAPKQEPKPEPTTPIWPPPGAMSSAAMRALNERAAIAAAERAATERAAIERTAPPPTPEVAAPPPSPEPVAAAPVAWPTPAERPASRQVQEERPLLARPFTLPAAEAGAAVEPVPRGAVVPRLPIVTWTRLLIVGLAALLAANWVASSLTRSATAERRPLPTTALATPLIVASGQPSSTLVAPSSSGPTGETQVATVTRIVDGDTIHVSINGTDYRVRYIGIDAPEPDATDPAVKELAAKATTQNAALVEGQEVYLEKDVSETDRYGRLLRDVWLVDSGGSMVLVNLELVRLGVAKVTTYPPDVRYVDQLIAAQSKAKADGLGLWAASAPQASTSSVDASPQTLVGGNSPSKCHPDYSPCLPIVADLDCPDVKAMGKAPVKVKGSDPYRLDADHDGLGCE